MLQNLHTRRKFNLIFRKVKTNSTPQIFCATAAVSKTYHRSTFLRHIDSNWAVIFYEGVKLLPPKVTDKCKTAITSPDFKDHWGNLSHNISYHYNTNWCTNTDVKTPPSLHRLNTVHMVPDAPESVLWGGIHHTTQPLQQQPPGCSSTPCRKPGSRILPFSPCWLGTEPTYITGQQGMGRKFFFAINLGA